MLRHLLLVTSLVSSLAGCGELWKAKIDANIETGEVQYLIGFVSNGDVAYTKQMLGSLKRKGLLESRVNESNPSVVMAAAPDVTMPNNGMTPLAYAVVSKNPARYELAQLLLDAGADPNIPILDGAGHPMLTLAKLAREDAKMIGLLKKYGAR